MKNTPQKKTGAKALFDVYVCTTHIWLNKTLQLPILNLIGHLKSIHTRLIYEALWCDHYGCTDVILIPHKLIMRCS